MYVLCYHGFLHIQTHSSGVVHEQNIFCYLVGASVCAYWVLPSPKLAVGTCICWVHQPPVR